MASLDRRAEKKTNGGITQDESISVSPSLESQDNPKLDSAAKFLYENKDVEYSHIDLAKLRHKIDRNVVSILCLTYIMAFLDKAIYNVGKMKKDECYR